MLAAPVGKGRVGDDNKCVMCEFALHFLQNMLEQKDTRVSIFDNWFTLVFACLFLQLPYIFLMIF